MLEQPAPARSARSGEPTLAAKIAFLSRGDTYRPAVSRVQRRLTHMSEVFLADDEVYKLKKPVRFPYLDFSTLSRREAACRAELLFNRRLAPGVYKSVRPIILTKSGLTIGGEGVVVDWLVVMKRLEGERMLDRLIVERRLQRCQLDRLVATLVQFYRHARAATISPMAYRTQLRHSLDYNRRILADPRFRLPAGTLRYVDAMQRRFLERQAGLLAERVHRRHIVDGHGDLRPEHIWIGDPVCIIDCLEFSAGLRMVDPLDEIAFLCLECERLGAVWAAEYLQRRLIPALHVGPSAELLFLFYRCHRATLRPGWRSHTCLKIARARLKNGLRSRSTTCGSPRPTRQNSNALSENQ